MTASGSARIRLRSEDRRQQLIGIGLRLLVTRPIHELAIDEVATEAGISRGLLFHYFPTKRDYYIAVVRAAGDRMLGQTEVPEGGTSQTREHAVTDGFVSFIRRRRANYVALVRAASGGDDRVMEVFQDIRATLTDRILHAMGRSKADAMTRLAVRGWLAMAEEMAVEADDDVATSDLVDYLVDALGRLFDSPE
ncbi:transcriptional regulator, TetR family [Nocardia amikacinitolerans]|uniref:TetR/AcrR family transcriptional regulator n=1 Tax=Nocardia amikacinitolerans TaxID=756689 RepID=UPI00082C8756|nr:TetR/AcrR family transcriptional regulator [Nocardia amikacinitolerans]MCP2317845.1 transcriptional regulator, TetR family [Nocardia amikacinitolerans]